MEQTEYFIKNSSGEYEPVHFITDANIVNVNDAGNYYNGSNAENVLQEVGLSLAEIMYQQYKPIGYKVKNYESNSGYALENFFNSSDWVLNGAINVSEDTINVKRGAKAVKLILTGWGNITKSINKSFIGSSRRIRLWVYCHNDPTVSIALYLSSSSTFEKFFMKYININKQGWNLVEISPFDLWDNTGGETWDNTFVKLRIAVSPTTGQACELTFSAMDYSVQSTPMILVTFDDGYKSVYSKAYPIMQNYSIKGTSYIIGNVIGTTNYMSTSDIDALYNIGWTIGNHTLNHTDFTNLTIEQIETAILDGQNWLINNGYQKTSKHLAYPFGYNTPNALTAANNLGIKTGRTIISSGFYPNPFIKLEIPATMPTKTTTLETLINQIDKATEAGRCLAICFHNITDIPSNTYDWGTYDFEKLMEYISARGIPTCTMDDYYNGLNL